MIKRLVQAFVIVVHIVIFVAFFLCCGECSQHNPGPKRSRFWTRVFISWPTNPLILMLAFLLSRARSLDCSPRISWHGHTDHTTQQQKHVRTYLITAVAAGSSSAPFSFSCQARCCPSPSPNPKLSRFQLHSADEPDHDDDGDVLCGPESRHAEDIFCNAGQKHVSNGPYPSLSLSLSRQSGILSAQAHTQSFLPDVGQVFGEEWLFFLYLASDLWVSSCSYEDGRCCCSALASLGGIHHHKVTRLWPPHRERERQPQTLSFLLPSDVFLLSLSLSRIGREREREREMRWGSKIIAMVVSVRRSVRTLFACLLLQFCCVASNRRLSSLREGKRFAVCVRVPSRAKKTPATSDFNAKKKQPPFRSSLSSLSLLRAKQFI